MSTLGIPHPSGYPLYVLLGKAWTLLLPFGSIAWRMSLFSACCAGIAVGLVYVAARAASAGRGAAVAAALLFAAAPSFWGEANVQRVYALDALFVALATWMGLRWLDARERDLRVRDRRFVALAFVCGLGASNHTFLAAWGAAFLLVALVAEPSLAGRWRTLLAAAGAALAGLSVYLYLPLRARVQPRLDWGDPETLDRFLAVVTRRDFWPRRWVHGAGDALAVALDFLRSFAGELTIVGAALALLGVVVAARRRRAALLAAVIALANLLVMTLHGSRADLFIWHRYYIPAYLCAALLAALGLDALLARLRAPRARIAAATVAVVAAGLLVPLRFRAFDRSRYAIADDYSRTLLGSLPPGSHLAATDDNVLFVLLYLQLVEGVRPDVDLIPQGVGGALPPLRFDPDREPLFFSHHPNWRFAGLDVVPVGLVYRVVRAGTPPPPPLPGALAKDRLRGEGDPRVPEDYLTQNLVGEFHFMRGVTWMRLDRARGLAELSRATAAAPRDDVLFYNVGLVYARMGLLRQALAAFERAAAIEPRALPGPAHARASDRVEELRRTLGSAAP